ncbi:MAG: DPP IV N-terminal domain-containing protein [Bacteroidales bacterium]|nr:DPP IV N-terminal domain-containing protein [Bacteroidales bacterium]MDD4800564.1 DPP IV N-terminal domain-containing protein [Proteiniphilum sp.]
MKKSCLTILILLAALSTLFSQGTYEDYQRAEQFLHFNVDKLVRNLYVNPNWVDSTSNFWYRTERENGHRFMLVLPSKNEVKEAFDHRDLANKLAQEIHRSVNADSLPFSGIRWKDHLKFIQFQVDSFNFQYDLNRKKLARLTPQKDDLKKNESRSPDGKWIAFVKEYNLFLKDLQTNEEFQLTTDGVDHCDYATPLDWYKIVDESIGDIYDPGISVEWSPDSKKFMAVKLDRRKARKLYLYQSLPDSGMRAKIHSYERALPGEDLSLQEYYIFDVDKKTKVKIDMEPLEDIWPGFAPAWTEDSKTLYFARMARYYQSIDLFFADAETGKARNVIHEDAHTMIEYQMVGCKLIHNGEKVIWMSERDGWSHLYLYDGKTGDLIRQVTKGEFVVREINYIDDQKQMIYFTASGAEKDRDPYFRHLYKINLDGTGMTLLTPEDAEHEIRFAPDYSCFIDNCSRVDLKPKAVLRRLSDGRLIKELQEANIDKLLATGWKHPERFVVKARDGKTDIYGILQYPSTFDPGKRYPIIDNSYSGPHAVNVPKSFRRGIWNDWLPLAEVGFIVVRIDGMGTAMRSKAFHDVSYKNLGDIGAADHIAAIRQLAEKYAFIDTARVGIFGHSAGGYDAAHAILKYPDFYKAAVASSGNHDHRMSKDWWPEQYMGEPGDHYQEQSNLTIAGNLKGKLMLIHGDMDNNVNPASTFRLAAELVRHNKDFDLVIIPNANHDLTWRSKYATRRRMDFFVKHLWNVEPPKEFTFTEYQSF